MRKTKILLIAIIILIGLSGCVQKIEKKESVNLFPAFEIQNNKKMWGYINDKGEFQIEPKYDETFDFSDEGIAMVKLNDKFGVVNGKGEEILEPNFQFLSDFSNGYFYAFDGKYNHMYNSKGQKQFFTEEYLYIGNYNESLFAAAKMDENAQPIFGYINKSGKAVIEAKYIEAWDFREGKTLVKIEDNKYELIGTDGKTLMELPFYLVASIKDSSNYFFGKEEGTIGILDEEGKIVMEPIYSNIIEVIDGNIVFGKEDKGVVLYGVADLKGNTILEPKFKNIIALGNGNFSVQDNVENGKYAIANNKGEIITDFIYLIIAGNKNNPKNLSVFDGEQSYLIDTFGKKVDKLPSIFGKAEINDNGEIIRVKSNEMVTYYDSKGKLIWEEKNFYILKEGIQITEKKFANESGLNIKYPVVEGLKDKDVEDKINKTLYKEFVEEAESQMNSENYLYYNTTYKVNRKNDLMIIDSVSEYLGEDDLHPNKSGRIYNISLRKGTFFEFKDLFKAGSDYKRTISEIILGQMEQKMQDGTGMYDFNTWNGVEDNQDFIAQTKVIDVYFTPEQLISYSEEFPSFSIEQSVINELLDLNSEFWWTILVSKGF